MVSGEADPPDALANLLMTTGCVILKENANNANARK